MDEFLLLVRFCSSFHVYDYFLYAVRSDAGSVSVLREKDGKHAGFHVNIAFGQPFEESDVFFFVVGSVGGLAVAGGGGAHDFGFR